MKTPENLDRGPQGGREYWWENPAHPGPDWKELFGEGSDREVLRRLVEGDPLDLFPLCTTVICEKAIMVEPERVFLRAAAMIATRGRLYGGRKSLLDWLEGLLAEALRDLLEEDRDAERRGLGIDAQDSKGYRAMVPRETGIEDGLARLATVVFNALPKDEREPFFHVIVEGLSVEECAHLNDMSTDAVNASIAAATEAIVRGCDSHDSGGGFFAGDKERMP